MSIPLFTDLPPEMPNALCAETDPELFYPAPQGGQGDAATAKRLCGRCEERVRCLDWAVATGQEYGIWGGTTGNERKRMRRRSA